MPHDRLSINQWSLRTTGCEAFLDAVATAGIPAVGLWRQNVAEIGTSRAARLLRSHGLGISSLCRGGFLTSPTPQGHAAALDDNRRAIDEAHELGATVLVMVIGGLEPGQSLVEARAAIPETIAELAGHAEQAGVRLALEPMHPVFAADRSVISTLAQAITMAEDSGHTSVGVVADSYHIWWDPEVDAQLDRLAGADRLLSYQVSDWVLPLTEDVLTSRGVMGDGFIDFASLTSHITRLGYRGEVEVEIFSRTLWAMDPHEALALIVERFDSLVAPWLG